MAEMRASGAAPALQAAPAERPGRARGGLAAPLVVGTAALLVAAGGLLWWSRGPTVFAELALAAFAWCF